MWDVVVDVEWQNQCHSLHGEVVEELFVLEWKVDFNRKVSLGTYIKHEGPDTGVVETDRRIQRLENQSKLEPQLKPWERYLSFATCWDKISQIVYVPQLLFKHPSQYNILLI